MRAARHVFLCAFIGTQLTLSGGVQANESLAYDQLGADQGPARTEAENARSSRMVEIAGLAWREFPQGTEHVIRFYRYGSQPLDREQTPRWLAQLTIAGGADQSSETWSDSVSCDGLLPAVSDMNYLPALGVGHLPAYPGGPIVEPTLPSTVFRIWSTNVLQHDRSEATVTMASQGGPIADWSRRTIRNLAGCWRDERPS